MSKPDLKLLLGRRIVGVILKEGERPDSQLFLVLDDGTYTEVYSDWLGLSLGWPGGAERARAYMASTHVVIREAHLPAETEPESAEADGHSASSRSAPVRRQPQPPPPIPQRTKEEFLAVFRNDLPRSLKN